MAFSKRRCIFCDNTADLSKEHIWPKWLRQYIPRYPNAPDRALHSTGLSWIDDNGNYKSTINSRGKLARPGEMADQKLRIVCERCNNGWMSQMQEQAKPFLVPRLQDNWSEPLGENGQRIIAAWAAMFTMVIDQADQSTIAISPKERSAFRISREPLPGWIVFLGRNSGMPTKFYHQTLGIEGPGWSQEDHSRSQNTHLTTFTVGAMLLQTMSSQVDFYKRSGFHAHAPEYARHLGLLWIWPMQSQDIGAPACIWSDQDFVSASSVLQSAGFFGPMPSALREAIASGKFDPTFTGYRK